MSNSSIWPIDRTLYSATTLGESRPGRDDNEMVFRITQSSSITEASLSDCLNRCGGGGSYSLVEMQSVYSTILGREIKRKSFFVISKDFLPKFW